MTGLDGIDLDDDLTDDDYDIVDHLGDLPG